MVLERTALEPQFGTMVKVAEAVRDAKKRDSGGIGRHSGKTPKGHSLHGTVKTSLHQLKGKSLSQISFV